MNIAAEQIQQILIVDDNLNNLKVLFDLLKQQGLKVLVANSGADALNKLTQILPDLILLDVMMPNMNGFEVCRLLKKAPKTQDVPIIFMTALSEVENKVQGFALGAVDYITKPLQQEEVLSRINLHLKLRSLTRSLQINNQKLREEIQARQIAEVKLHRLNQELEKRVAERTDKLLQAFNQVRYQATHDPLTNLLNRSWLMKYLEKLLQEHRNNNNNNNLVIDIIIFIDLDKFKSINDRFGHGVGDEVLKVLAKRLQKSIQHQGEIARLGGDEFLIIFKTSQDEYVVEKIGEHLLKIIQKPVQLEHQLINISASIGIVKSLEGYQQPTSLLRDADIAMYQAKHAGRGQYVVLNPQMKLQALERIYIEAELRQAVEKDQFFLCYQPIISLANYKCTGFESLIRWQHPTQGVLSPNNFIPIAEETGIITKIDWWIIEAVSKQLAAWQTELSEEDLPIINFNLSTLELQQSYFFEQMRAILKKYNVCPKNLKLEITEGIFLEDNKITLDNLQKMRRLGMQICIDDFGTGYSSLSRLHSFPVDVLKIDRSFVIDFHESMNKYKMIETIISLAKNFQMKVVAEGVELTAQLEKLDALGCNWIQGFLFSKPLLPKEAIEFKQNFAFSLNKSI